MTFIPESVRFASESPSVVSAVIIAALAAIVMTGFWEFLFQEIKLKGHEQKCRRMQFSRAVERLQKLDSNRMSNATSALLMFVQVPAPQAQVTVDVVKITCEQLSMEELPFNSRDVIFWLSGYYHREHDSTVIEPGAIKRDASNLNRYCYQHGEMTVMDAVKNMGLGK